MWETPNTTWIEMRAIKRDRVTGAATEFLRLVKDRSHLFRGVTYGTIVRGEGSLLRARHLPRTGRQYRAHPRREVPHPAAFGRGRRRRSGLLPGRAAALGVVVRDLSHALSHQIFPIRSAQLLILERRMPRSLVACFGRSRRRSTASRTERPRRQAPGQRNARAAHSRRHRGNLPGRIARVPDRVPEDISELGNRIQRSYLGSV